MAITRLAFLAALLILPMQRSALAHQKTNTKARNPLHVAFPTGIEPWILAESESGFLVEVVTAAASKSGLTVKKHFMPLHRARKAFEVPHIDIIAWGDAGFVDAPFRSTPVAQLEAVLVYPKHLAEKVIERRDLSKLKVLAFQGASGIWPEIGKWTAQATSYSETSNQQGQVSMLLTGRVDLIILERQIFRWWSQRLKHLEPRNTFETINIGKLIEQKPQIDRLALIFRNDHTRSLINQGIEELVKEGTLSRLKEKYSIHYPES